MNTSYNVSIDLNLGDKNCSDEEILEIIAQDIEIKIGQLFRVVGLVNFMVEQDEITSNLAIGYIQVLTEIGYAMSSSREESMVEFRRNKKSETKTETPNILDLSGQATGENECIDLAKHISSVLNDPRTPEVIKANVKNGLSDLYQPSQFMITPEYIAAMLCDEANQNKEAAE